MSWLNPEDLDTIIIPRSRDLGGFEVQRVLPTAKRRMVGPFIFFDQMGPVEFLNGGIDVRPHPHIGLATVTYLLKGEFQHRDSIGTDQMIYPGDVNWMVAGRGVTHSERTSEDTRRHPHQMFGIQTWVALPERVEDMAPTFQHVDKAALPLLEDDGKSLRLIVGSAYGEKAPVETFAQMFYADVFLAPGAVLPLPDEHEDRAIYLLDGSVEAAGQVISTSQMVVFHSNKAVSVRAGEQGARLVILGGETLGGSRYIWWNFVASSQERIEAAKQAWKEADFTHGPFKLPVGDTSEFIPIT